MHYEDKHALRGLHHRLRTVLGGGGRYGGKTSRMAKKRSSRACRWTCKQQMVNPSYKLGEITYSPGRKL